MSRSLRTLLPADLERRLLAKGIGELAASVPCCADCGRTPLLGERLHRYERGVAVCELCRPRRAAAPERSDRVRHPEHGLAVRLVAA